MTTDNNRKMRNFFNFFYEDEIVGKDEKEIEQMYREFVLKTKLILLRKKVKELTEENAKLRGEE
jgi:hypothetical protein